MSTLLNLADELDRAQALYRAGEVLIDQGRETESFETLDHGINVLWLGYQPAVERLQARFKDEIRKEVLLRKSK